MSFEHLALVREAVLPSAQKVLLYALGSRANTDGRSWPSIDRLCRDTGLSRRAVQIHLGILIALCAVERTTHPGRPSDYRLNVTILRALAGKNPEDAAAAGGQLADEGRMPCAPPAHVVRTPVHPVRPGSASHAPEVKEEVSLNNKKLPDATPATVDNVDADTPWWRSRPSVMLMGAELGIAAAAGEPYSRYKDRVYQAWRARLYQSRNTNRGNGSSRA